MRDAYPALWLIKREIPKEYHAFDGPGEVTGHPIQEGDGLVLEA